jgi:hypothetical protein
MTHFAFLNQEVPAAHTVFADDANTLASTHPPVFLHCGWRTRGTWIWNRFRGMPGVTAYYEPLGDPLARIRLNTLASMNAGSWPSGHRGVDRPYFDEFRPLLRPGRQGVRGYQSRFATADFFAAPDAELPELYAYLRSLLHVAQERGDQPVLKFCRSLGRIGWMRRHFPDAIHVVVMRDPFTQFASSLRQFVRNGNGYFLAMPLLLLAMNRDLPLIRHCTRHLGVELPHCPRHCPPHSPPHCPPHWTEPRTDAAACEAYLRDGTPTSWYRGFLAFWVATAAMMPETVDLIVDSDALAHSRSYRSRLTLDLARLTGQTVDFDDADVAGETSTPEPSLMRRSDVLRAHAGAEAFLTEQTSATWADTEALGQFARKLAEARSHALGVEAAWRQPHLDVVGGPGDDPEFSAALLPALARAAFAERELAAIRSSRSWRMTAPLRWLRQAVG